MNTKEKPHIRSVGELWICGPRDGHFFDFRVGKNPALAYGNWAAAYGVIGDLSGYEEKVLRRDRERYLTLQILG